ncbi:hypothetical protein BH11ARM2_BH11ARM2_09780 [soil metagenome]
MAKYTVVPFLAAIKVGQGSDVVAQQLNVLINQYAAQEWDYQGLEAVTTIVNNPGCMGCGASNQQTVYYVAVFRHPSQN